MAVISGKGTASPPAATEYIASWGLHENYIVTLEVRGDSNPEENFSVATSIDESFSISLGAQWDAPFANVLQEAMGNGAVSSIAQQGMKAAGISVKSRATSAQVWQSSDPIGFQIPFTFIAQRDPKKEVQDKIQKLLKLVAPSLGGGGVKEILGEKAGNVLSAVTLKAPGPTLINQAMDSKRIILKIGNFLRLDNCIIERVDVQFDSLFGSTGIPHKAKATVDIKSYFTCFTTTDIDSMFLNK
jgi:hypothetical protein